MLQNQIRALKAICVYGQKNYSMPNLRNNLFMMATAISWYSSMGPVYKKIKGFEHAHTISAKYAPEAALVVHYTMLREQLSLCLMLDNTILF